MALLKSPEQKVHPSEEQMMDGTWIHQKSLLLVSEAVSTIYISLQQRVGSVFGYL